MAVVKMLKIKLMGLNSQKQKILNALYRTSGVELSETEEYFDTFRVQNESDILETVQKWDRLNKSITLYCDIIKQNKKSDFYPKDFSENDILFVGLQDFLSAGEKESFVFENVKTAEKRAARLSEIKTEKASLNNLIAGLKIYENVNAKFSDFVSTKTTEVFFGSISQDGAKAFVAETEDNEYLSFEILSQTSLNVVSVVALKSVAQDVAGKLNEYGFLKCPYNFDCSAKEKISEVEKRIKELDKEVLSIYKAICEDYAIIKDFKICSDYYSFEAEKLRDAERFSCTETTFILEGFIPADMVETVKSATHMVSDAVFMEFSEPDKEENVPTLLKNNYVVKQTEFVTDLYSSPDYKELDPNRAVTFFFLLLMGVIMADIGYGIVMAIFGAVLSKRINIDNGAKRLWNLISFGGISTIIFGFLFNSLFGFAVLPFSILPSPVPSGNGIDNLMIVLVGCLALGIIQIAVGYFLKGVNSFIQGDILGGILEGLSWVAFFIGFVLAVFNFLVGYLMPNVLETMNSDVKAFFNASVTPGIIIVIVSLICAAIGAAIKEKGFSKVSKFLGTFYGLINIMSDILSYARVFGLMLSGMIIAQTFNDMSLGMFAGGGAGYVFGALIFIVGHVFNLAMGVLGAYIHVSRLQYIEFFSKFYTGEGNKFAPLGSELKYVAVNK